MVFILVEESSAVNYTWTGTTSTAFNTTTNWAPNGLPGASDYITIVNAANLPILANNVTVARLTVSSGTLNLNTFTITLSGRITTTGGAINNGNISANVTRASLANATFGAAVTITTDTIELNTNTFSSSFSLTYRGTQAINNTTGGNTFNGTTSITQTNTSNSVLTFGKSFADIFNGVLTITNNCTNGTKWLMIGCKFATSQFNNNVTLNLGNANSIIVLGRDSATTTLTLASGRTITSGAFTAGYVEFRNFLQNGTTAQNFIAPVTGYFSFLNARFGGSVTTTCGAVYCTASVFNGASNVFTHNAPLIPSHISSGVFAGTTANTFINNASGRIDVSELNWADVTFNGPANFYNNSTGQINIGIGGTVWINDDVKVYSTGSGDVAFQYPQITLATTKTITAPTFSSGSLYIHNFKQLGTQAQNITLTGSAKLYLGVGTVFNGSLTASAPNLFLNGGTYNGATNLFTQTGTTINSSIGGCTFAGATSNTITNTGTGEIRMATSNPDIFNGPTTFTNSNTGTINVGYSTANNQLNQNVTVNSSAAGTIAFAQSTGTCVLANTKTISEGTFTAGNLRFRNFTQTGTTNQAITLTGTASTYFETGTTFNAQLLVSAPNLFLNGSTFNGYASFIKTSSTLNISTGGNTFNGWLGYISNWGNGEMRLSNTTGDIYSSATLAVFDNQGTGITNVAYNGNTQFNGSINVHSIANGTIAFSQGTGTATLAVGRTINPSGFTFGNLRLKKFTQLGTATTQILTTTGTSSIYFETGTTFNSTIYCTAPNIYLNGATFNGFSKFTKTAGISNFSVGGNTFNGATEIINNGTDDFTMGTTNPDKFYGTSSTFTNNGSGYFDIAYSSAGNQFAGTNMIVNSTTPYGIWIGFGGGTTTFQYGNIFPGYLGSFIDGPFSISNFTYLPGSMMQEYWTLTGNAYFQTNNSTYNNVIHITAPSILLSTSVFNNGGRFYRTGNNNDYSFGGNTFGADAYYINQSTVGSWYISSSVGDTYQGNVYYSGSGTIYPAASGTSNFEGTFISMNMPCHFGALGGTVRVAGSGPQMIMGVTPTLPILTIDKTANEFYIDFDLPITNQLNMQNGALNLNGYNLIITNPNPSAITRTAGYIISEQTNNNSKLTWQIGTNTGAHVIPFGNSSGNYIPFTFNLNSGNAGNVTLSTYGTTANNLPLPTTPTLVTHINDAFGNNNSANTVDRFWQIDVTGTTANATLTFKASPAEVGTIVGMKAQRWNSTTLAWDTPLGGQTSLPDGVIVPNVTQFSPWTLSGNNSPLPIELLSFNATPHNNIVNLNWITATETNNDFFTVERSTDGIHFEPIITVDGAGNSFSTLHYSSVDEKPIIGVSYYRLKQTDYDGQYSYSNIVSVAFNLPNATVTIYPNPSDNGMVYIQSTELNDANLICRITNSLGEIIFEKTVFINGATLIEPNKKPAAGIYTLTLLSGKTIITQKLIIR